MKYLSFFILLVICNNKLFAQTESKLETQIDSLFSEYSGNTAGVAVAVVQDGKTIFQKGYGLANLEYNLPININTLFNIGSVSKQFTAFAIYLLQEEGKISLEDDVRKYIPELPQYDKIIKIKHLLAHTSGLRDQWALLTLAGWRLEDVITENQILKLVSKQKKLNFETGTQFMYSNTGYTLAAVIIERVSGKSFAQYCQENIFNPLKMTNTLFYDDYNKLIKNRAYSYEKVEGNFNKRTLSYTTVGATSLFTTVEDLAKWVSNFHNPLVGNAKLIKKFNEISYLDDNSPVIWAHTPEQDLYYAKGQLSYEYKGLKVLSHGGHDAGFRAVLTRFPKKEFAVITLSNNEHYTTIEKSYPLAEIFLKDYLKETKKDTSKTNPDNTEEKPYSNQLNSYEGIYYNEELATQYQVKLKDGQLVMTHPRLDDISLTETGKNKFDGINSFAFELEFFEANDKIEGFYISNFGAKNMQFDKVKPTIKEVTSIDQQLKAYNNRDINAFLDTYHEDIAIYNFPNQLLGKGKEFLRTTYQDLFQKSPNLNCLVTSREVLGNTIIDQELVTGFYGDQSLEAIAIYKMKEGKIAEVYFIKKEE
ncbi:serine hydrolase [Bernardetia sp. MNP-M8]|uniref:serine hydrolase n=1 Tax=Bernardetia sp. MNP-M8 TaxID=3127470 RepID=UPI0030D0D7C0